MGELVVQVGCSVGNDADREIKTGDGFWGDVIGGWRKGSCSGYGVGGAKLATVKEKKEARSIVSSFLRTTFGKRQFSAVLHVPGSVLPCTSGETLVEISPTRSLHDHSLDKSTRCNI